VKRGDGSGRGVGCCLRGSLNRYLGGRGGEKGDEVMKSLVVCAKLFQREGVKKLCE